MTNPEEFLRELAALCKRHGVMLLRSHYAGDLCEVIFNEGRTQAFDYREDDLRYRVAYPDYNHISPEGEK